MLFNTPFINFPKSTAQIYQKSQKESMKTLTNIEKGRSLRTIRKTLHFTQNQMAERLELDPTYLSQLENGSRPVDEWYLQKAQQIFEKSNSGSEHTEPSRKGDEVEYWQKRAEAAESALEMIRSLLKLHYRDEENPASGSANALQRMAGDLKKSPVNSETGLAVPKDAVAAALNERTRKAGRHHRTT